MTKKDFVAIAAAIKEAKRVIRSVEDDALHKDMLDAVDYVTDELIPALRATNPRFNVDTFKKAADYGTH